MILKSLVNNKELWTAFLEELDGRIEFTHKQMEQAQEPKDLFRLQGEVQALRRLKLLREKLNGYSS